MSDEKKPFEREDDEVLAIIEEYRKKYASEDVQDEKATPADEKPPEPKAESPIMAHFHDTAELRASSAQSTLNIEAHLTSLNGQIPPADPVEGSGAEEEANPPDGEAAPEETAPEDEDAAEARPKKGPFRRVLHFLGNCSFLVKATIYVVVVLIVSAYLSYMVITVGNDVFAFVKGDREVTVTIPEGATRKQVAYLLESNGLIEHEWAFNLFSLYRWDDDTSFIPGEHTLNTNMNYSQMLSALTVIPYSRTEVRVTVPEGYTVDQIIELLVSKGIGEREKYVEAINEYPYKHEFVRALEELGYPETRKYRLEGYLYPDTYDFYQDDEEYLVINKFLNNFQQKFWSSYKSVYAEDIEALGFTFDDVITLASMVQAEAKYASDFEAISYVFHNRLKHSDTFPKLESDATIQYVLSERKEDLTGADLAVDSPYNTYLYEGLPPGAICNPGIDAITTAIYPAPPTTESGQTINAYFFVSNKKGTTYYAVTSAEHESNKKRVERENAELEAGEESEAS